MLLESKTRRWTVMVAILCLAAMFVVYPMLRSAVGPMAQHESQCLICHRQRVEKWVGEEKLLDSIASNQYAEWIDSFVAPVHSHIWLRHTGYHRLHWFGPQTIACGGIAIIPRIFEQRVKLGEQDARRLLAQWHRIVQSPTFSRANWGVMQEFETNLRKDPRVLLKND